MKTYRNPDSIHKPLASYSHQIELDASERLLVLSGQVGMRPDGSIPEEPVAQLKITLENIRRNLEAAGMAIKDIVKLTIYLVDQFDAAQRRQVLAEFFQDIEPCMTLLFVAALGTPGLKVEIDVMASAER
ncbi:MAG: RidA family protein [Desulfobacteraceae bacterium]|nr:MAG: RidA family protein [Desulfobacteraceae bacterium]